MRKYLIWALILLAIGFSGLLLARRQPDLRAQEQQMKSGALRSLRGGDEAQREEAVHTLLLSRHGTPPQLRAVADALLRDPSARVRAASVLSLEFGLNQNTTRLTDSADQVAALAALASALGDDPSAEVRSSIARFLPSHLRHWRESHRDQAALLRSELLPQLRRVQVSRDPRVRRCATEALRELGVGTH